MRWFSLITSLIAAVFFLYMFLRGMAYSEIEEARAEKRATDSILNSESIPAPVEEENVPEGFFRVRGGAYNNISILRGKIDGMLIGNAWTMTDKERITSFCYYCDIDTDIKLLVSYSRFQQYETNDAKVKKRKKPSYPLFTWLEKSDYSYVGYNMKKGMALILPPQPELYYISRRDASGSEDNILMPAMRDDRNTKIYRSFGSERISFFAAEKDFMFRINEAPCRETMKFMDEERKSVYLLPGETYDTGLWTDRGDQLIIFFTGSIKVSSLNYGERTYWPCHDADNYRCSHYYCREGQEGFISLHALDSSALLSIEIKRGYGEKLDLEPGKAAYMDLFEGDEFVFFSKSRFYLNGKLQDPIYGHYSDALWSGKGRFTADSNCTVEIRASVNPKTIYIRSIKRRGY